MNDSHELDRRNGWTLPAYIAHNEALRKSEDKFQAERDRRYAEVTAEREKALKIKETADLAALQLARDIQTYKDEKANELREQISSERGLYASKDDLAAAADKIMGLVKPLSDFVTSQQGRQKGIGVVASVIVGSIASLGVLFTLLFVIIDRVAN